MRLLVLGGTSFVGRMIVEAALARGHAVTTFRRGRTGPDVPGAECVTGDRSTDAGLLGLHGRTFDAAVDPSGVVPAYVLRTCRALAPTVGFYAYVSSISVYPDTNATAVTEHSPVHEGEPDEPGDPADMRRYGQRKAGCEQAVRLTYPADRWLIVRPGTIIGPHDNLGLSLWWLNRISRGGAVLAPGRPDRALQLLDVRDLAAFLVRQVEQWVPGVVNTVPDGPNTTMGQWLAEAVAVTGSAARLIWVEDRILQQHAVRPWWELPWWLPDLPAYAGAWAVSGQAAAAAGLRCRPAAQTVHDTWRWLAAGGIASKMPGTAPVGLPATREQQILDAVTSQGRRVDRP